MGPGPELGGSRYPARTSRRTTILTVSFNCRHRRGPTAGRARAVRSKCRANARTHVTCAAARARTLAPLGPAPAARHLLDTFVIRVVRLVCVVRRRRLSLCGFVTARYITTASRRRAPTTSFQRASGIAVVVSRDSCGPRLPVLSPFYRLGTYLYLHELPWFRIMY